MTVCAASIFVWRYGLEDLGTAIVAASDRMLTDEGLGIEFQGSRGKWSAFGKRLLVLVAGEMVIHSEVMRRLFIELKDTETPTTFDLAELVSREIRTYRSQEATRLYLSPLNLDIDSFLAQQRNHGFRISIRALQSDKRHGIEAECLVLGCDKEATIFRVDRYGLVTNHTDIGFASIGGRRNTFERPFHA